jgi:D-alanyl-D-alanine carboxypeptidase/D-alanyl-D-alanine-endopeptidase (penicillin-binding protein 4)
MPKMPYSLFLLALLSLPLYAQNAVDRALMALEQDPDFMYASIGFCAIDIEKNTVLAQRNPNLSLIPASTLKVVTTGTALAVLGPNFRYTTTLEYDGQLDPSTGTLRGNVYLRGSGDPSLGSPYMPGTPNMTELMQTLVDELSKKGIQRIEGSIIGDASCFDADPISGYWQVIDLGNYYGAGAYGLNLHDNFYRLVFQQNPTLGAAPKVLSTEPNIQYLDIKNLVRSAGANTGDNAYIYASPYQEETRVVGTIPVGAGKFGILGAIPNPPLFAAQALNTALKNKGIIATKGASYTNKASTSPRKIVYTHYSPTLFDLVKHTNEESRNHYCEAFMRSMGQKIKGKADLDSGIEVVRNFWAERGIDVKGFFLFDGSGLSARNGIPAKVLTQIVRKLYVDEKTFHFFDNCLPIAGKNGTMASVCKGTPAAGNIKAKTGTLNRVRCFTGYATTKTGKKVAFTLLVNNHIANTWGLRKKLDQVLNSIIELE